MARIVDRELALTHLTEGSYTCASDGLYMEIMEPASGRVWLCFEPITREEFEAFEPDPGFVKSGVGRSPMDLVGFRRSPGAEQDGPPQCRDVGGRPFVFVAIPELPPKHPHGESGPMQLMVQKHQTVGFDAGNRLHVLCGPDGHEYVQQTGDEPDPQRLRLPEGWSLRSVALGESLTLEMQDEGPTTWWFPGMLSFQGPVEGLPV